MSIHKKLIIVRVLNGWFDNWIYEVENALSFSIKLPCWNYQICYL